MSQKYKFKNKIEICYDDDLHDFVIYINLELSEDTTGVFTRLPELGSYIPAHICQLYCEVLKNMSSYFLTNVTIVDENVYCRYIKR